jgi:hypothetical protein
VSKFDYHRLSASAADLEIQQYLGLGSMVVYHRLPALLSGLLSAHSNGGAPFARPQALESLGA